MFTCGMKLLTCNLLKYCEVKIKQKLFMKLQGINKKKVTIADAN